MQIVDGKGSFYKAIITNADPHECGFTIKSTITIAKPDFSVHLAIAPTKNADRMEWMVEKAVEIGIDKISFIQCKTSERKTINLERLEKIVISAMKQSQKAWLPEIAPMIPFERFISASGGTEKFIAHVDSQNPIQLKSAARPSGNYLILIGPEGDFTNDELAVAHSAGFQKVRLGPSRLRTETAGLAAIMTLNLLNQ